MGETEGVVLAHLRYIRSGVDALRDDVREVKDRLGFLIDQCSNICNRMTLLNGRLERIEHRLDRVGR